MNTAMGPTISIRPASPADLPAIRRVAERDSRPVPEGAILVAAVDGEIRAALSLSSSEAVADPFHPTAALVDLLSMQAREASRDRPGTRGRVGKLALRSAETY